MCMAKDVGEVICGLIILSKKKFLQPAPNQLFQLICAEVLWGNLERRESLSFPLSPLAYILLTSSRYPDSAWAADSDPPQ